LEVLAGVLSDDTEVMTCTSGERALRILDQQTIHVVCSDFQMPGMNGLELLGQVTLLPYPVACLLLTGADEYLRSSRRSPYYMLLKPFDGARLLGLVLQLARLADMKRSVSAPSSARVPSSANPGPPSSAPISATSSARHRASPRSSRRVGGGK
jgi:DNA-binding NtrC family response regulator